MLDVLGWCIVQVFRMLAWTVQDLLGHATAKVVVPLLTLGTVRVDRGPFHGHSWRRTSRGIVLGGGFASFLGQLFWVVVLAAVGLVWLRA